MQRFDLLTDKDKYLLSVKMPFSKSTYYDKVCLKNILYDAGEGETQMNYEELSISGFINEVKEVSSGPHPRKFCFLLGAGASISSGIKSEQELVNIWDRELEERNAKEHLKWKKALKITEENKYSFYSRFYEERFRRHPADGYNFLEKLMEHAKPSVGYVMLSYLLTKTKHNVVITTNFDHLTEDAVNYYAQIIPLVVGHESLAHYVNRQINRPTVIKIHRDLLFDPKNRTDELEELHENWKKALGEIFSEYHPIFIGYAGNDNSLMNFLLENSDRFREDEWSFPYWMLYGKEEADEKVLNFLTNAGGYLIRHNGFDEVMYLLGAAFSYKLQSREDFLGDAEKRYLELSNAIDKFTESSMKQQEGNQINKTGEEQEENQTCEAGEEQKETMALEQAIEEVTSQTEQQRLYRQVVFLHNNGRYNEAWELEKRLVEMDPANSRYYYSLGVTLHELMYYEKAEREKRKAVELEPSNAGYHDSLGITLHEMKRYEEAEEEKRKATVLEPTNARYHEDLGITLHVLDRCEEAVKEKRKAVELEPMNAKYHDSLSVTLHKTERFEEAEEETRKAIALEPMNAFYHDSLSATLHKMGRHKEAEEEARKAIELDPLKARYYNRLGVTLHEMDRLEEAEKEKRKAVELEPENAMYHDSLGITLHGLGHYEEAKKETEKAIELAPQIAGYYNSLGVTLHEMERYEEAEEAIRKAIELAPLAAQYYNSLGITLYEMERYEEAKKAISRAIELEPGDEEYSHNLDIVLIATNKGNTNENNTLRRPAP